VERAIPVLNARARDSRASAVRFVVGAFIVLLATLSLRAEPEYRSQVESLLRSGDLDAAAALLTRTIEQSPDDFDACFMRGMVRFQFLADYDGAIVDFTRFIDSAAGSPDEPDRCPSPLSLR